MAPTVSGTIAASVPIVVPTSSRVNGMIATSRTMNGTDRPMLRRGGLVGEQHLGPRGDGPGDADPLLLPAGELRRVRVGPLGQPDQVEQFGDPGLPFGARHPGDLERERHVAGDGPRGEQGDQPA
ncbi:hypothetical protein Apa02nite_077490 [Actinoplanes palleronii]|uniref:Uncharacterized protein n=1 Tax=Actinoplanes palleronii TaxID=113570 RepID=A0ABQ4BLT4_9ACTN|nr:hypothetical protein Apa02nite_077490 [Actinoplanes palleronii]